MCIESKDSALALENYLMSALNLLGEDAKVCYVGSDRGTENLGGKFALVMRKEKIEPDYGPAYTPELNGVAKRFNKTVERIIRDFMCDSGSSPSMWDMKADAEDHSYNSTPHKSIEIEVAISKFSPNAKCHLKQIKR